MTIQHLQLVIPEALSQLRQVQADIPVLLQCLQQGERSRLWNQDDLSHARLESWQQSLLHAMPAELRQHGLSSAALSWRGEGGAWRKGSCLLAEPVHLEAGMDDLRCVMPPPLNNDEAIQLMQSLQPLLSLSGFELLPASADATGTWYLWCDHELELTTFSLHSHFGSRVYELMPQGADAAELRRLMTEVQMLLHEHPVNQQRARRGIAPVNSLWFWGMASLQSVPKPSMQRVVSDAVYVRGLCEHLHVDCWPVPPDVRSLLSVDADQVLLVLPAESLSTLESKWLQPLHAAMVRGEIKKLDLYLDHWCISLKGGRWQQLRRSLARRHELSEPFDRLRANG